MVTAHTESVISPKRGAGSRSASMQRSSHKTYWMPSLLPTKNIEELYAQVSSHDLVCIGSLYGEPKNLKELCFRDMKDVGLFLGPEGDFTAAEVERVIEQEPIRQFRQTDFAHRNRRNFWFKHT